MCAQIIYTVYIYVYIITNYNYMFIIYKRIYNNPYSIILSVF